jgi:hypothetical protein
MSHLNSKCVNNMFSRMDIERCGFTDLVLERVSTKDIATNTFEQFFPLFYDRIVSRLLYYRTTNTQSYVSLKFVLKDEITNQLSERQQRIDDTYLDTYENFMNYIRTLGSVVTSQFYVLALKDER